MSPGDKWTLWCLTVGCPWAVAKVGSPKEFMPHNLEGEIDHPYFRGTQRCMLYFWWHIFQKYSKMHVMFLWQVFQIFQKYAKMHVIFSSWHIFQKYSKIHVIYFKVHISELFKDATYFRHIHRCMLYYIWHICQKYSQMHVMLFMAHMSEIFKDACDNVYGAYFRNIQWCMLFSMAHMSEIFKNACYIIDGAYFKHIQRCMYYYPWHIIFGTNRRDLITFKYDIWYYQELIEPFPSKGDYHQQVMRVYRIVIIHVLFPHDTVSRSELNQLQKDGPIWTFAQHRFPADFGFLPGFCAPKLGICEIGAHLKVPLPLAGIRVIVAVKSY